MNQYSKTYSVSVVDIDADYNLSSNATINYIQNTIASFLSTKNLAAFDIVEEGLAWVVVDYSIDFTEKVPVWSNAVNVALEITELGTTRVFFDVIFSDDKGNIFCKGFSTWTIIDINARRPFVKFYDYLTSKMDINLGNLDVKHPKLRFPKSDELFFNNQYVTQSSDIDFNGHVNNRTYFLFAMSSFGNDFMKENVVSKVSIRYIKETFLGEVLNCLCFHIDADDSYICDITNGSGESVCSLQVSFVKRNPSNIKHLATRI